MVARVFRVFNVWLCSCLSDLGSCQGVARVFV